MIGACLCATAQAQPEPRSTRDWHEVEVVVFRHRGPAGGEQVVRFEPRTYPRGMLALQTPPPLPAEAGSAPTALCVAAGEGAWAPPETGPAPFPPAWLWLGKLLPPAPAQAETPREAPGAAAAREAEGDGASPRPANGPEDLAALAPSPMQRRLQWSEENLALANSVSRMRGSGRFEVLAHGRWLQATPPSRRPRPVLVQFGARRPGGAYAVEGTISVSRGRYIDLDVALMAPESPAGTAWQLRRDGYALLDQARRLRPGETHYLDHPRFGAVVRVSRLTPP